MIRFILCYLFVWFVFSTLGSCRAPQHRNLDRAEYSMQSNINDGGFDTESRVFLTILYGIAPR